MSRKTMIALLAAASVAVLAPNVALAHGGGGGGGGGGHGGGGGGGGGRGGGGGFGGGAAFHSGAIGGGGSAFRSGAIVGGGPGGMRVGGFTANSRAFTANNCESAWGPYADRHAKPLIHLAVEGQLWALTQI